VRNLANRLTSEVLGKDSLAHHLLLVVLLQPDPLGVLLVVLLLGHGGSGDESRSLDVVSLGRHGDVDLVGDGFESVSPQFLLDSVGQESVTGLVSYVDDTLLGVCRGLDTGNLGQVDDLVDKDASLGSEFIQSQDIDLVDDEDDGLVVEQGLDGVEKLALSLDGVSTLLRNVHKVEDGGTQVGKGSDGLHLDRGKFLQGSVYGRRQS